MQAVEDADDGFAQRGAAHYGVVDDDEIVGVWTERTVSDVVDVGGQVVAAGALGDERAQLDVLDGHLFGTDASRQDAFDVGIVRLMAQIAYGLGLLAVQELVETLHHAVESHLGRVGDV